MRALVVDRSLEAIAGMPASVLYGVSGPSNRVVSREPLDDMTLFGVMKPINSAYVGGFGSFGSDGATSNGRLSFQTGPVPGPLGIQVRLDTLNGVVNSSLKLSSNWEQTAFATRIRKQDPNFSLFTLAENVSSSPNLGDGIINKMHGINQNRAIASVLYTSALTDDEIQRVLNWLTARYLT